MLYTRGRLKYVQILLENLKDRDHLENLLVDWILLKWILNKQGVRVWTELIWFRNGTGVAFMNMVMNIWVWVRIAQDHVQC